MYENTLAETSTKLWTLEAHALKMPTATSGATNQPTTDRADLQSARELNEGRTRHAGHETQNNGDWQVVLSRKTHTKAGRSGGPTERPTRTDSTEAAKRMTTSGQLPQKNARSVEETQLTTDIGMGSRAKRTTRRMIKLHLGVRVSLF